MIHRTRFVTFPRSGHHWLIRMLQERIGPEFVYDEHHQTGKSLENSPEINAQKTHDFVLNVPASPEFRHVIQIRHVSDCIRSWWKMLGHGDAPSAEFIDAQERFYAHFISRWVASPVPNRIVVPYAELVLDTENWLNRIVDHITH